MITAVTVGVAAGVVIGVAGVYLALMYGGDALVSW